jgi:diguanylate cyclase (GGDEF)-like protein/PAS domain S-box-containing protein
MLSKRTYQILVIACPAFALAAGALLYAHYPEFVWHSGGGIVTTLSLILYLARPDQRQARVRQLTASLRQVQDACVAVNLDGEIQAFNTAAADLLGERADDFIRQPFGELADPKTWTSIQAERQKLLNDESLQIDASITLPDEEPILTRCAVTLIRDDADRPEYILITLLDIPDSLADDAGTAGAETRLQQTLELTSDLIITLDGKGRIARANTRASDVLLAGKNSLLGTGIIEFVEAADRKRFIRAFSASRKTPGEEQYLEKLKVLPGGRKQLAANDRFVSVKMVSLPGSSSCTMLICQDITAENQSRNLLRSSEARFSRIFHTSPDAILLVRYHDSVIFDFNQSFTRLFGYTREDAIGMPENEMSLFYDRDDRDRIVSQLQQQGECTDIETRLRSKSGHILTVEVSLRHIEIDGELCTMCVGRDMSEKILVERARRESEEKFSRIFSESPDGIIILRQNDLTIYDVNDAFINASEYSREELIDKDVMTLNAVTDIEAFKDTLTEFAAEGALANEEMSFKTRSGKVIPVLISAALIELNGEACALCITKDIQDLRDAEQRLMQSEQRFRGAFENAPIGIMLVNASGQIFEANRFAAELLAYNLEKMENLHISRLIPAEDRGEFKETLGRLFSGQDDTMRSEKRMLCNDGMQIWTNFHIGMQRTETGGYGIVQIADITEMKSNQRRIERMAFYDTLTDLANRRLFHDRLSHAISHSKRSKTLGALLYLDLDQFKRVNDTLGHEMGDVLLQEVATRLSHCVRQGDTVGRPGGDEFTILLTDIKTPSDAGFVADKILQTLAKPISLSGHQIVITTSIGITIIPEDGTEVNALMKNADLAMYRAKEHGRNNYQYYSEELNTNAVHRLRLEYEMRRALERDEFVLYYQPKVRLSDQQVTGVECLIRWQHPERGLLSPVEFIDVAEETGAIVEIGTWVIEQACRAGRAMVAQTGHEIEIAVNISPRQFKDPNLVNNIRRSLRETGLNPHVLEVEITETMLMGDIEAANQTVQRLHELGVKLAIDDFGTGYSSLNYLKKFPIDTVKVDRSFVMDIPESSDDMAITSAVIAMAHRLNMVVVAEGVETREQLEFLQEHGCEYAQGYLFSKPMPLAKVKSMLAPNVRLLRGT